MAARTKVGAMIRRGAANIPHETMAVLVKNKAKVEEIVAEIDGRVSVFRELEQSTQAEAAKVDAATAELVEREAALKDGLADLSEREVSVDLCRLILVDMLDGVNLKQLEG